MDSLARLLPYLRENVGQRRLRMLGLYDYMGCDARVREPAVEAAVEAFLYLACSNGSWNGAQDVLAGVISFLRVETDVTPTRRQCEALAALVREAPLDHDEVRTWFRSTFA